MKSPLARLVEIFTKPKIDLSTLIKLDRASVESNLRHTDFFRGMSEKEKNSFLSRIESADEKDQITKTRRSHLSTGYVKNLRIFHHQENCATVFSGSPWFCDARLNGEF